MKNKLAIIVAMIAIFAAIGTISTTAAIKAFAQSEDDSNSEIVPGSDVPRSQLERNCANGNNLACNALNGCPGCLTIHIPGEPPLNSGLQFANPNNNGPAR